MYLQVYLELRSCVSFSMILLRLLKLFHKFHSHLEGMVNTPKKFIGLKILESFTFQRVTKFIVVLLLTAEFQHRWAPGAENITGHLAYSGAREQIQEGGTVGTSIRAKQDASKSTGTVT